MKIKCLVKVPKKEVYLKKLREANPEDIGFFESFYQEDKALRGKIVYVTEQALRQSIAFVEYYLNNEEHDHIAEGYIYNMCLIPLTAKETKEALKEILND